MGYSPWDMTEQLSPQTHIHTHTHTGTKSTDKQVYVPLFQLMIKLVRIVRNEVRLGSVKFHLFHGENNSDSKIKGRG